MSTGRRRHATRAIVGSIPGLLSLFIGEGLLTRADTPFGRVWAAFFLVGAVIILLGCAVLLLKPGHGADPREVTYDGEPATYFARGSLRQLAGWSTFALLGGWFLVMGVVGAIEENWFWPVLAAVPAVYFLGFPVLALVGRFRLGGVWITPTKVVNESLGLRSEIALADIATAYALGDGVRVQLREGASPGLTRLTPKPWRARTEKGRVLIATAGLGIDGDELARELIDRALTAREPGRRRRI